MRILSHDLYVSDAASSILKTVPRTVTVIDVGCGIRPCPIPCEVHICVEPHLEYLDILKDEWHPIDREVKYIQGTADKISDLPKDNTTLLLLDVIEHMDKDIGKDIVEMSKEFTHTVIFTPVGFMEQAYRNPDPWGLRGGYWQKHRSGWTPDEFNGWKIHFYGKGFFAIR